MNDKVTPREEAIRRAMVGDGFDPTDPEQRAAYANTVHGSAVGVAAEAEVLRRGLAGPVRWLLDKITRRSTK